MVEGLKLHLIGNAHIDPVWLWRWPEGCHEVHASFRSALDRMKEDPEFVFTSSSAAFYAWIEELDPPMFAEIQERVAQGRWQIVGGWWIQPDCNLPAGESFVRQGLIGQRYFKEKFGRIATVGYNVDSFGHSGMLPQILKKSGMDHYIFLRPSPHEKGLPGRLFWWEADDGSRVLAYRIPYEYCSWGKDLVPHIQRAAAELGRPHSSLMCFYGVGNHGGGPTRENLASIHQMQAEAQLPDLVLSSPETYFEEVAQGRGPIPVVHDDLQHHASGCYAAHSGVKRWNRKAENLLLTTEKLSALADGLVGNLPAPDLNQAWKNVLFNQFHDILAGTSLEEAYEDTRDQIGEASAQAHRALNRAMQAISWAVDVPLEEGAAPLVVFNPNAWACRLPVELEVADLKPEALLLDDCGQAVPMQAVQSKASAKGRYRIAFQADLPALGYRLYRLKAQGGPSALSGCLRAGENWIENEKLRLTLNPQTGNILSLWDRAAQVEVFAGEAARAVVLEDPADTWGHNVFRFDHALGEFELEKIELTESGPVRATLRVTRCWGQSRLMQDFSLYAGRDSVEVQVWLDWREARKLLKLRFPLNQNFMRAVYEIPYGHMERFASGDEEPAQNWLDVSGIARDQNRTYGLSLLNDGKYSFDVAIREIGLTAVRSPLYAHHLPIVPDPQKHYDVIDQGIQTFHYSLLPHEGSWESAGTVRRAWELNQPALTLPATFHEGRLPGAQSLLTVEAENVVVTVLKRAEEGEGWILRAYETAKVATETTIRLPLFGREIRASFGPCEIKTFWIPAQEGEAVVETNLLEWQE